MKGPRQAARTAEPPSAEDAPASPAPDAPPPVDRSDVQLVDGSRLLHQEAAGVIALDLYGHAGLVHLLGDALAGDVEAQQKLSAIDRFAWRAERTETCCATCDDRINARNVPDAVGLVYAHRADPRNALVMGVCSRCVIRLGSARAVRDAMVEVLRHIWPDLRRIEVSAREGRA